MIKGVSLSKYALLHERVSKRLKRGSLDLALGPRGRAKKALDLCLFRGMDQSKGSAAIDTYPINQKYNRSRPKLMQLWNSVQIESFLASSRSAVSCRKR